MTECSFHADVMARTQRGATRRIKDVRCMQTAGHTDDHSFFAAGTHTFGASREQGRWVSRR